MQSQHCMLVTHNDGYYCFLEKMCSRQCVALQVHPTGEPFLPLAIRCDALHFAALTPTLVGCPWQTPCSLQHSHFAFHDIHSAYIPAEHQHGDSGCCRICASHAQALPTISLTLSCPLRGSHVITARVSLNTCSSSITRT